MRYQVRHCTTYQYDQDVSLSHHLARLTPARSAAQQCLRHELWSSPAEATRSEHVDHFGNVSTFLTIEGPHRQLKITASSLIEVAPRGGGTPETPRWEEVRDGLRADPLSVDPEVVEFTFASPLVPLRSEFGAYAAESFGPGRPVLDGVRDLASRIHRDFTFDSKATHVATSVGEFFKASVRTLPT
jgi:transglutaminase-like putative cysteine protease